MINDPEYTAAVIGLGSMGLGIAQSLIKHGINVVGFDVNPEAVAQVVRGGGRAAISAADAGRNVDATVIVVVNAAQTGAVLFGDDGAAAAMRPDGVIIACATMAPED